MKVTGILSGRTLLIAGLGLALTTPLVQAQDRDPPRERQSRMIQLMDTDEDQKVTVDEIKAEQKRLISAADLNGDGKLDVKEFSRRGSMFRRPPTTTLFDLLDANGDQVLTAEEISAPSERWFKRYDVNGDGKIETSELPYYGHGGRRGPGGHGMQGGMKDGGMKDGGKDGGPR